jgi:hypothetical protein
MKSRLQTHKGRSVSIPRVRAPQTPWSDDRLNDPQQLAALVYREEGVAGFFRGLWVRLRRPPSSGTRSCRACQIPLMTISFVRAASFTIYTDTKEALRARGMLTGNNWRDAAIMGVRPTT